MGGLFGGGPKTQASSEPRLGAIRVQTSVYGRAIPLVWGKTRIQGNLIWYGDFVAVEHHQDTGGGKGGGANEGSDRITYTYEAAVAIALCRGPVEAIPQMWQNRKRILPVAEQPTVSETYVVPPDLTITVAHASSYLANKRVMHLAVRMTQVAGSPGPGEYTVSGGTYTFNPADQGAIVTITYRYVKVTQSALARKNLSLHTGGDPQPTWGYLDTRHPAESLRYNRLCYVSSEALALGQSAAMPLLSFEVRAKSYDHEAGIDDANPRDVVSDLLALSGFAAIGNLTGYSDYCIAAGLFVSLALTEQRAANQIIAELLDSTNTAAVWSEGVLKLIPYADAQLSGNGKTYTPDITPIYHLSDDDFLADADPVRATRLDIADAYNQVQIEFSNRGLSARPKYDPSIAEAKDQAMIEAHGLRPRPVLRMPWITEASVALYVAYLLLWRGLYIRTRYEFVLGWRYALLEPMDIVTLTDPGLGLDRHPVRIIEIEEDEDGQLRMTAEDFVPGVGTGVGYAPGGEDGYNPELAIKPGNTN